MVAGLSPIASASARRTGLSSEAGSYSRLIDFVYRSINPNQTINLKHHNLNPTHCAPKGPGVGLRIGAMVYVAAFRDYG